MKLPVLIGILIGVVIFAAAILSPQLRSTTSKEADDAAEQAALAERLLDRHEYRLPRIERLSEASAMEGKQAAFSDNAQRLSRAAQVAGSVRTSNVLGAAQVSGMVEYTRAAELFAEAQGLRLEQRLLQGKLLRLGAQWVSYRAKQDYLVGLDVRDILTKLRNDLAQVREDGEKAAAETESLRTQVSEREAELASTTAELEKTRSELLSVEQAGFTAGDDASFDAYRERFTTLAERIRLLGEKEQLLSFGGMQNAEWSSDELDKATLSGGEEVVGLDELKRRLERSEENARRWAQAAEALTEHIGFIEQAGRTAKQGEDRYAELQNELDAKQKEILPDTLIGLAKQAAQKETEALRAARDAVGAFGSAQQAADQWVRDAREVQSDKDSERKNERLKMMVGDSTMPQVGDSAKATALLLSAHIHAQRIEADQSLIDDLKRFVEMRPGSTVDTAVFEEEINTSRDEAVRALEQAEKIYERLEKAAPANTKWVPQAGLATVYHLAARINTLESAALLAKAFQAADAAVKDREQSPYLVWHVRFRDHLRELTGLSSAQPAATDESMFGDAEADEEN